MSSFASLQFQIAKISAKKPPCSENGICFSSSAVLCQLLSNAQSFFSLAGKTTNTSLLENLPPLVPTQTHPFLCLHTSAALSHHWMSSSLEVEHGLILWSV